jgi:hypothetical protein
MCFLRTFGSKVAVVVIVVTGSWEQWIFFQQVVLIDVEEFALIFRICPILVGVVSQKQLGIDIGFTHIFQHLVFHVALVDGVVSTVTKNGNPVMSRFARFWQRTEKVICVTLQRIF